MALFRLRIPSGFHYGLLALAWATLFFETLLYTVIIPITPEVLHLTPFYQGVVYIGHPLTSLILTPFSGWLIDHIGWRTMLWFPYPVLLTGSIVFAIKNSLPCYFVARALHGISSAVVWPLMLTAIAKTHPKAIVASALGVAYSSDVGTVIGPVVGGVLFALGGTRCVFVTIIVISSLLLICAFVLHPFLPADETQKPPQQEHDSGTTTEAPSSALNVVTPASLDAPASSGASTADTSGHAVPSQPSRAKTTTSSFAPLMEYHFMTVTVATLYLWGATLTLQALLPLYWHTHFGTSPEVVGALFLPSAIVKVASGFLSPIVSDWLGVPLLQLVAAGIVMQSVAVCGVLYIGREAVQCVGLCVSGVGLGMADACVQAFVGHYCNDRNLNDIVGKAYALTGLGFCTGTLLAPLIGGLISGLVGFHVGFLCIGLCGVVVAAMAIRAAVTYPAYRDRHKQCNDEYPTAADHIGQMSVCVDVEGAGAGGVQRRRGGEDGIIDSCDGNQLVSLNEPLLTRGERRGH